MIKNGLWLVGVVCSGALIACSSAPRESRVDEPLVDGKYQLSADREALDRLREQVPPEKRQENDEIAFTLQWMSETKMPPAEVRNRFNAAVSKKRNAFNKDMDRRRKEFVRKERQDREEFTRESESARRAFSGLKRSADERKKFYDESDQKRRDFHAGQRERRDEFEGDIRDRRRNFEDYVREKTADFNQEHRVYSQRYDQAKKDAEILRKKEIQDHDQRMNAVPAEPLGAGQ
ncbi:MAG: hypothetical protein KF802_12105 [Bdellovibrionaceae bacterium]|nr:hypothetical protein [Pseudobdellovibrionaceae bacterium]MBX3032858.1 hypothetical protein [Pseudobdellovibrionaceae bacterium]